MLLPCAIRRHPERLRNNCKLQFPAQWSICRQMANPTLYPHPVPRSPVSPSNSDEKSGTRHSLHASSACISTEASHFSSSIDMNTKPMTCEPQPPSHSPAPLALHKTSPMPYSASMRTNFTCARVTILGWGVCAMGILRPGDQLRSMCAAKVDNWQRGDMS